MFELPECLTLVKQMNETLKGKRVRQGCLGNSPHKFVWYNRKHDEFEKLTRGKTVGKASAKGRWMFVPLDPGYVLVLGECGGRILYHPPGSKMPDKYHLFLLFDDDSFLTVMTQMWGAMELFEKGREQERKYVKDTRPTPVEPSFTLDYFDGLIDLIISKGKQTAKGLLTQDQMIPGLGNAIAQDILFHAGLDPKHSIAELTKSQRHKLYDATVKTVRKVTAKGGRYDEFDLYGLPGKYVRIMDNNAVGKPCPECGTRIIKIQYLGGACYFCPKCQT